MVSEKRKKKHNFSGKKFEYLDKIKLERRYFPTHLPAQLLNMEKIKKAKAKVNNVIYSGL